MVSDFDRIVEQVVIYHRSNIQRVDDRVLENRGILCEQVKHYHSRSKTLSDEICNEIDKLKDKETVVLFSAHQPNLFPYSGVMRKFVLLEAMKRRIEEDFGLPCVSFFGFHDQDFADDEWMTRAYLPDPFSHDGVLKITYSVPDKDRKKIARALPKPSEEQIDSWQNSVLEWIRRNTGIIRKELDIVLDRRERIRRLKEFFYIVRSAYNFTDGFVDFSSYITSTFVNKIWSFHVLSCFFSQIIPRFDGVTFELYEEMNGEVPYWYHCDCLGKVPLERFRKKLGGTCLSCHKRFEFDSFEEIDRSKISIRAADMPVFFLKAIGYSAYVSGAGATYMSEAKKKFRKIGLQLPPTPVWRVFDYYDGIGQLTAMSRIERIKRVYLRKDEEQPRKYLKDLPRIQRSLELFPSILDFSINVGLKNTGKRWLDYLLKEGNLKNDLYL